MDVVVKRLGTIEEVENRSGRRRIKVGQDVDADQPSEALAAVFGHHRLVPAAVGSATSEGVP
jgi:hypothetical protein